MDSRAFWRPGDRDLPRAQPPLRRSAAHPSLPAAHYRTRFLHLLETHRTLLVTAATGSGKTTQLPQYLADGGWSYRGRAVAVVLPTRVAVLAAAARVAQDRRIASEEIGGREVGYVLPFQARRSSDTAIVYYTAPALVAALRKDPTLGSLSVVMIDDAHERPVAVDVLLCMLRVVQERRGDLRIVIASASLSCASDFVAFFGGPSAVPRLNVSGRNFPVRVHYARSPVSDYLEAALAIVVSVHAQWAASELPSGSDVLVFVPGVEQVNLLCESVSEWASSESAEVAPNNSQGCGHLRHAKRRRKSTDRDSISFVANMTGRLSANVDVFPLHAALPPKRQLEALEVPPDRTLRVVVATPIAQSSLTLPSVRTVIDSGFENTKAFSSVTQSLTFATVPISKASALQRAGRAGRLGPGVCYRLYTREHFENVLPLETAPEILRSDLSEALLSLSSVGVSDLGQFSFIVAPPRDALAAAFGRLHFLGAFGLNGRRSSRSGLNVYEIPLPPHLARALLEGQRRGVGRLLAVACAMLQVSKSLFTTRNGVGEVFAAAEGDVVSFLNIYRRWVSSSMSTRWSARHGVSQAALERAHKVAVLLKKMLHRQSAPDPLAVAEDAERTVASRICRSLAVGLFSNLCTVMADGCTYRQVLSSNATAMIHPESVLHGRCSQFVVAAEMAKTKHVFLRHVSVVDPEWLVSDVPSLFQRIR